MSETDSLLYYLYFLLDSLISQSFLANPKNQFVGGGGCCCGQFSEIFFPNLILETGPYLLQAHFSFTAGQNFGGWTVTPSKPSIIVTLELEIGVGQSKWSQFLWICMVRLDWGGISYDLFGLTPGNQYRIDFGLLKMVVVFHLFGNLKLPGCLGWMLVDCISFWICFHGKESYMFMAMGTWRAWSLAVRGPIPYQEP